MSVTIRLPTALRPYADQQETVALDGKSAGEVLKALLDRHEGLKKHMATPDGKLRSFVNVYLNDEDLRSLQGLDTPVKNGDTLLIVPAIAGGSTVAAPEALSKEELARYHRHIIMPEVGLEGQKKLKKAKVLTVGAGGLGSPLSLYLAAAGVGTIGIVDFDAVEASNLQRQIVHSTDMVGRPKLESAAKRLKALNPHVEIAAHETKLTSANALDIFKEYDVIADGTDNFPTRYLVNDACVLTGKPNVYGSIFRFEGQASVFHAKEGPCYRCLYPEPPPPGLVPSCAEGGVLGVLPGIIGTLQAVETIKLILGIGKPLIGRLMLFDALGMEWRTLKLRKDPNCPACGKNPTITKLIDYEAFCGLKEKPMAPSIPEISVKDLKTKLDKKEKFTLLDVREPHEYEVAKIEGSTLIPLGTLPDNFAKLDKAQEIVVHCKMGGRSARAVQFLREKGYNAVNVAGGINAWSEEIDPSVPTY
jgi:sulfur-carrier protein adenylyltransferase/sulfurtransferase